MNTTNGSVDVDFIRSYMKVKNHTEPEFAALIGVSNSTLNRVLNGKRGAGKKVILGILTACPDVRINQLIPYDKTLPKGNKTTKSA